MSLDAIAPDVDIEKELAAEAETPQPEAPVEEVKEEPEVKQEAPKEEHKEKYVPYGALHEERQKRKEMQARAEQVEREAAERLRKLEERHELMLKKLQNPVPKFEEDPANHLKHEVETLKPVTQEVEQLKKTFQEQAAAQEMSRMVNSAESEFMKEKPDYLDAVSFLKTVVDKNLQLMGVDDPSSRLQLVNEQAVNLAKAALQGGKNPAQVAYELARNYGYQAKKQEPSLDKKIETLEKGQKATPSMPSGGKKETALSLAALEAMDDDEFNAAIDDPVKWRKLISG